MIKLLLVIAMVSAPSMSGLSSSPSKATGQTEAAPMAGITCFKTGEQTSGMNKICYYDCLGSPAAITISAVSLCPLSIKR